MKGSAVRVRASASVDQRSYLQNSYFLRWGHATLTATRCRQGHIGGFKAGSPRAVPELETDCGSHAVFSIDDRSAGVNPLPVGQKGRCYSQVLPGGIAETLRDVISSREGAR